MQENSGTSNYHQSLQTDRAQMLIRQRLGRIITVAIGRRIGDVDARNERIDSRVLGLLSVGKVRKRNGWHQKSSVVGRSGGIELR